MRLYNGEVLFAWPLAQHCITAGWLYNNGGAHNALDFRAAVDTPVYAAEDGVVSLTYNWNGRVTTGDTNSYGNLVKVRHANYGSKKLETLYAHLKTICVKAGASVKEGQMIGYSGETGNCQGAHLHFEVIWKGVRRNPLCWLDNNFTTASSAVYTFGKNEWSVARSTNDNTYKLKGIDASKYQKDIDWERVKASGISFAIIKAGYGRYAGQVDPYFESNYAKAKAAGLPLGAYWYSYAKTPDEAVQEANWCLSTIAGKSFEYPIWFDQEDKTIAFMTADDRAKCAKAFMDTIISAGYKTGFYAYTNWLKATNMSLLAGYDLWVSDTRGYNGYGTSSMWQYGQEQINGITTGVADVNYCYKDYTKVDTPVKVELQICTIGPMTTGDACKFQTLAKELGVTYTSKYSD